MKKLIALLMIICLATCGCSKQDEPTATNTPTTAITETPTKSADTSDNNANKMACAVCGEITDCTAFTQKRYNYEIGDYIKKVFYLCDDCYLTVSRNETDYINYECMIENTQLAICFKENYKIISALEGEGYIIMDSSGVSFENIEQGIIDQLYAIDSTFDTIKTQKTYRIKVSYGKYATVTKDIAPVSILDTID